MLNGCRSAHEGTLTAGLSHEAGLSHAAKRIGTNPPAGPSLKAGAK